ncbi:hypothetical protein Tco_0984848, partial [Tanacetum coccineum]
KIFISYFGRYGHMGGNSVNKTSEQHESRPLSLLYVGRQRNMGSTLV